MVERVEVGDRVRLRKAHPCGSDEWKVVRIGMDVKMKCCGCSRIATLPRAVFQRRVTQIVSRAFEEAGN